MTIYTNIWNTSASNESVLTTTFSYQCKRSACRKAESPSMISRMEIVNTAKKAKITKSTAAPTYPCHFNAIRITIPHSTSDNSAKTQIACQQTAISTWNKIKLCVWVTGRMKNCLFDFSAETVWIMRVWQCALCSTHVRAPDLEPRVGDKRRCLRCSPGSTLWCGWPDALIHLQYQTPAGRTVSPFTPERQNHTYDHHG